MLFLPYESYNMAPASFLTILCWLQALRFFSENYKIYRVGQWLLNSVREYTVSDSTSKTKLVHSGGM